jgi:hypothetical protein
LQGTVGLVASALLANYVIPRFGATGCFLFLAFVGAAGTLSSAWLPQYYERIPIRKAGIVLPTGRGLVALATIFSIMAGIVAAWVLLPLLLQQMGYPTAVTSVGMPLSLGMQIAGGLSAAAFASRLTFRWVLPAAMLAFCAMLALLLAAPGAIAAIVVYAAFGFLWMFLAPFGYSYTLSMDPSRASVMFMSSAQLLGAGTGPLFASLGVVDSDVRGGVAIAMALLGVALILFMAATRMARGVEI